MSEFVAWALVLELTIGLAVGGYLLYQIQTTLALIVLQSCGVDEPTPTVTPHVLTAEVLDAEPVHHDDDRDTTGTFTGTPWN